MSASTYADRLMLDDVEYFADTAPGPLAALVRKDLTTSDLLDAMRRSTDLGVTVDDLARARDAIDSLARARDWELTDDLLNGSHFPGAGDGCRGCRRDDGH